MDILKLISDDVNFFLTLFSASHFYGNMKKIPSDTITHNET